ncbi:hypothetical protein VKT23_005347 [Stygiomarasmius scandens]|uniref:Homeobox domain-containing protein n=1 Tax=Marasmiellus scandens TaxID=2682957 RepID=A0ABR1JRC5_9AGAR
MSIDVSALQQVLHDATAIKELVSAAREARNTTSLNALRQTLNSGPSDIDITFEPLCIHIPDTFHIAGQKIYTHLEANALLSQSLDELLSFYQGTFARSWQQLRAVFASNAALRNLFPSLMDRLRAAFQTQFEFDLDRIVVQFSKLQSVECEEQRQAFNNDYIPFLQRYFEYDSYPSAQDREIMAQKSGMTSRQIEVWFQNHRRVARKTGAKITKRQSSAPGYMTFTFVDQPSPPQKANEEKMKEIEQQVRVEAAHQDLKYKSVGAPRYPRFANARDIFDQPAPSYAFPVVFSPPEESQQFQHRDWRPHFPPPEWMRKPTEKSTPQTEAEIKAMQKAVRTAVKEMQAQFAQLSVRDTTKVNPGMPPAATFAFYLTPSLAPHPARVQSTAFGAVPTVKAPAQDSQAARKKKVAGPPRRTPKHAPRRSPAPYTKSSPSRSSTASRSPTPPSRTPSLELSSSLTRHSSVSSLSSLASTSSTSTSSSLSAPTTPESSTVSLPYYPTVAVVDSDVAAYFNSFNDDLFGLPLDQGGFGFSSTNLSFDDPFAFDGAKDALNPSQFSSFSDILSTT